MSVSAEKDTINGSGRLVGRVTLVTGAARGIGRRTALVAAAEGARVVVSDVADGDGEATAADIREAGGDAVFVAGDVSDAQEASRLVATAVERFGGLDVLVNNAGIPGVAAHAHDMDVAVWDEVIAVNLRGPFLCSKYAIPHLMEGDGGAIVNIASTLGLVGALRAAAYCAAKGGLVNLTRQLATDYGPRGLRVNAVCPGIVDTDMAMRRAALPADEAAAVLAKREDAASLAPLGRQAQADEIARVVVFLASGESSFVNGAIVPVDGGSTATYYHGGH
jgi:NAD(P)-dependent dehydrogenase (short-subunit alcohol dehydrogenase family)